MTEEEMKAKIAEAETAATLKQQELDKSQEQLEALKRDNETLLNLNKKLQLAVGVRVGDDSPAPDTEKKKTPQEKQSELIARILNKNKGV